jgi:high affinity sulfate transporter 1
MGILKFSFTDYIPILGWLPEYFRHGIKTGLSGDIVAGLTVGVLIMPQAIAYAQLAGLPPVQGLYSSLVPMIVYFFFGTSKPLSVGPVSMVSLSVATALTGNKDMPESERVKYAVIINFFVGITYILMGFARLGNIIDYIQEPIISGFTSAAAVIVIVGQLPSFLGLQIDNQSSNTFMLFIQSIQYIGTIRVIPCVMAFCSLALNFFIVKRFPSLPSSLIITIGTAILTWIVYLFTESTSVGPAMFSFFELAGGQLTNATTFSSNITTHMTKNRFMALNEKEVEKYVSQYLPVIGEIKPGLPKFYIPRPFSRTESPLVGFWIVTPVILVILLGFMESISISKKYAEIQNYKLNCNQELIALGLANLGGSFFSCYSVAGSFSRTAVNAKSGATSLFASLITACLIAVFLYGFTFLLYYVPKCTLAVILILAVYGLVDIKLIKKYIKHKKILELCFFFAVFLATVCYNTTAGLVVGTVLNIIHMIIKKRRGESLTPEDGKTQPMVQSNELIITPDEENNNNNNNSEQGFRLIENDENGNSASSLNINVKSEEIEMQKLTNEKV